MPSVEKVLLEVQPGDIVEFDRGSFKHYALYIGGGLCVHVTVFGPVGLCCSASNNSTPPFFGRSDAIPRSKIGTKIVETLVKIANGYGGVCRINNFENEANKKGMKMRSQIDALALALKGLVPNSSTTGLLGARISVEYKVGSTHNCEGYVTHWKYNTPSGFSLQVEQFVRNSVVTGLAVIGAAAAVFAVVAAVVAGNGSRNNNDDSDDDD